jgi:hypothetical protein
MSCRPKTDRSRSEGPQPHIIDLSFPKRVLVSVRLSLLDCNELQSHIQAISLFTSHPRDDSYTPSKISISAGTGIHDLHEVGSNSPPFPAYRRAKLRLLYLILPCWYWRVEKTPLREDLQATSTRVGL